MTQAKKILVIDDDLDTCHFLRELFEDEGWQVAIAANANAAMAAVQAARFDLIVSDINLNEELNGLALLKHFRQLVPEAQVILISGFGTLECWWPRNTACTRPGFPFSAPTAPPLAPA